MAGSGGQKHLRAANRSIKAAGLHESGLDAALVEFLRDSARQIDRLGLDGVSARLISAYLSAQKDLGRAAARKPRVIAPDEPVAAPVEAPKLRAVEESPLEKLRKQKNRAS